MSKQHTQSLCAFFAEINAWMFASRYKKLCIEHGLFLQSYDYMVGVELLPIPNMEHYAWDREGFHIEYKRTGV